jgi:hypothetical protein
MQPPAGCFGTGLVRRTKGSIVGHHFTFFQKKKAPGIAEKVRCSANSKDQSNRRKRLPDYAVWEIHPVMKLTVQ